MSSHGPMKIAYADPPYPGQSAKHYGNHPDFDGEVDHGQLARDLREYDGWVLHTSTPALYYVQSLLAATGELSMNPGTFRTGTYRVMAWVKPFAAYKRNVKVAYTWEPVLVKAARPAMPNRIDGITSRDYIAEPITMKKGLTGVKPERMCWWAFEVVGAAPEDELHDLFPGSGAVASAWDSWRSQLRLGVTP